MAQTQSNVDGFPETLILAGHPLRINFSDAASKALALLSQSLEIEMELYFSCLIRKRVYFRNNIRNEVFSRTMLGEKLSVSFRPVMTEACLIGDIEDEPGVEIFPLLKGDAFVPKWLTVDYRHDQWQGQFGFD
ncbi:MAG TPA: hypothetical protein ENG78_00540 [Acidiferrobacteraceae bacterium]|nr:hypothetical protein [Acidiferrobacteraceae bacterium]HEX19305.1 hypothetical protein [Acidiferrobacteraceae bacterium]